MKRKESMQDKKISLARPPHAPSPITRKKYKVEERAAISRWMYLIGVLERLSELNRCEHPNLDIILKEAEANLNSLNDVFTKDIDPVSDLEGYAVHRLSREFAILVKSVRFSRKTD